MKVSISTIKKDKVFLVLCLEKGVTKEQFQETVKNHFFDSTKKIPYNFFAETNDDTLAMVVIPDVNQDHDCPQIEKDI